MCSVAVGSKISYGTEITTILPGKKRKLEDGGDESYTLTVSRIKFGRGGVLCTAGSDFGLYEVIYNTPNIL